MKMSSSEEEVLHIAEDVEAEEEEVSSEVMGEEVSSEVEEKEEESTVAEEPGDKLPQKIKGKGKQQLTAGVVYLSRIPPFMRPRKVRHLLSRYGDIGRVYLQPEGEEWSALEAPLCVIPPTPPPTPPLSPPHTSLPHTPLSPPPSLSAMLSTDPLVAKRRRKFRKNRKRNYTEGWVEFTDKRVAKATAMVINNTQIGGKKRYYYHDDTWNMKYLSKFRWSHLTEKIGE